MVWQRGAMNSPGRLTNQQALRGGLAFVALITTGGCSSPPTAEPADLIFNNGLVYTGIDTAPKARAIATRSDRIIYVGSNRGARRYQGPETRVVDLRGATVFPGLADAHAHLALAGGERFRFEDLKTKEAFLAKVKELVRESKPGEWVTGRGWTETQWTPPMVPTRQDLDAIAPNNPVYLTRVDGHTALVNTRALEAARVTKMTTAPAGGALQKDVSGHLTGILIDRAQRLVSRHIPPPTEEQLDRQLVLAAQRAIAQGWTQVHDMGGSWSDVARLRRLYRDGELTLRVYKAIEGPSPAADSLIAMKPRSREFGGRLTVGTIKVTFDGTLGNRGALLLKPYRDDPSTSGLFVVDTAALYPMLVLAARAGIQVSTHAIGDRANRLILGFYERAFSEAFGAGVRGGKNARWRVEHASVLDPADIPRFKALAVIPSPQPAFTIEGLHMAPPRLGAARMGSAYAWQSLAKLGIPVPGGTDVPVTDGDPLVAFYAAVTRRDLDGSAVPDSLRHPEETVTRWQALKMFTAWPAYAAFEEDVRGTLAVGKWADLTVLDQDIMTIPELEILKAKTVMTVIAGEIVYEVTRRP